MKKKTKLIHLQIIGNEDRDFYEALVTQITHIKNNLRKSDFPYELEFIITSDRINLQSTKELLKELADLYKREHKKIDIKKKELNKMLKEAEEKGVLNE